MAARVGQQSRCTSNAAAWPIGWVLESGGKLVGLDR